QFLRSEVADHQSRIDLRQGRDVPDRGAGEAALAEQLRGGRPDELPSGCSGLSPAHVRDANADRCCSFRGRATAPSSGSTTAPPARTEMVAIEDGPGAAPDPEELPGQRKRSITSGLRRRIRLMPPMVNSVSRSISACGSGESGRRETRTIASVMAK